LLREASLLLKSMLILAWHILFPLMKKYAKNLVDATRENLKRCDRRSLRSDNKFSDYIVNFKMQVWLGKTDWKTYKI